MKRFFTMLGLTAALIILLLPTAAILQAEQSAKPMQTHDFTDVPVAGQEFMEPYIDAFYHQGITGGCSAAPLQYCPANPVTRGSMAVFMGRALGYVDMIADGYNARAYFKQTTPGPATGVVATSINGFGVWGRSDTSSGVRGSSEDQYGVAGTSTNSYGLFASSHENSGLYAQSNTTSLDDTLDTTFDIILGGNSGELFSSSSINIQTNNNIQLWLDRNDNSSSVFVILNSNQASVFSVDEAGNMTTFGNLVAGGSKSAIVDTVSHGQRLMYAVEATENWFEDFGSAQLVDGEAVIEIDPIFAETVNLTEDYHIYLTPIGGAVVLYIDEKTPTSFTVRAEGASNIQFDYRIVAKRLGYEDVRMEEVTSDD